MKSIMVRVYKKTDINKLIEHSITIGYKIETRVQEILKDRSSYNVLCFGSSGFIYPYLGVSGYKIIKDEEFLALTKEDVKK